ncbi:hypothetical protein [Labedella endophytica]|uniref:Uncharacterized protein n=1 Tax=Labedella endophytica TaxID=1523160 RepID=A0A433JUN3_9MICO|nr:hypothetical protein [Labedella endophytica]RUR01877.1 hypothetical protein ELQ94_10545 [Labedella endophytica]
MSIDRVAATTAPTSPIGAPAAAMGRHRTGRAELFLTWIDPIITGSLVTPSGLALGNAGRRTARSVVVDVPNGPQIAVDRLRRNGRIVVASLQEPGSVAAVVAVGTVFVDWTDHHGQNRSAWLRVPPLPSRFRANA